MQGKESEKEELEEKIQTLTTGRTRFQERRKRGEQPNTEAQFQGQEEKKEDR